MALTPRSSWRDRLRFTVLLGVSSSINIFADRLPRSAQKLIKPQAFTLASRETLVNEILKYCVSTPIATVRPGPELCELLLVRQREHVASIDSFVQSLKVGQVVPQGLSSSDADCFQYVYMTHFYGNPFTILLDDQIDTSDLDRSYWEAGRNLPSCRK